MIAFLKQCAAVKYSFVYAIFRGTAKKPPAHVQKVLVVQTGKLGDMVCTTPMFHAIKRFDPSIQVHVLGNRTNKDLLAHNSDVADYMVLGSFRETRALLKKEGYDAAFLAGGPDPVMVSLVFLSKIPLIIAPRIIGGYSPWNTWLYRLACKLVVTKEHRMGTYAPREYLRLLEPIGIVTDDTTKHLGYSEEARAKALQLLPKSGGRLLVGMSPSAGNKIKEWPTERFAEVADYLIDKKDAQVLILGGLGDKAITDAMISKMKDNQGVTDLQGRLSIDELKAFMTALSLFISVDTGPIYIAEAFNVPTIDIVGPMDEREQPPIGKNHAVIVPPNRKEPELHIMNARRYNVQNALKQRDSITVEMVERAIDEISI